MPKVVDITGQRFGFLVAIRPYPIKKPRTALYWLCKCDCGAEVVVRGTSLRRGATTSCGCFKCMTYEERRQAKQNLMNKKL